jgi:hypothetical protein
MAARKKGSKAKRGKKKSSQKVRVRRRKKTRGDPMGGWD